MSEPNQTDDNGSSMVYHELHAVIKRYLHEAPEMTVFQAIGALEAVKIDVLDMLCRHNQRIGDVE